MICLNSTQTLEAVLGAAPAATQPVYSCTYATKSTAWPNPSSGSMSGVTTVTLVPAPGTSDLNMVKQITVYNGDTAAVLLTIRLNASGTYIVLWKGYVPVGRTLFYSPESGFQILNQASGELAYTEKNTSTSITATTSAGADLVVSAPAIVFDGATVVLIEFFAPYATPDSGAAGRSIILNIHEDGSHIGYWANYQTPAAAVMNIGVHLARRLTPSAGSHTYSARAYVSAGTGTIGGGSGGSGQYMPTYIRILRI